jgi:hypothetical protein
LPAEEITVKRYRCVCKRPNCPGKRRPWLSKEDKIPEQCSWCKRPTWGKRELQFHLDYEQVTIKRYRCICEQPRCIAKIGKGRSWISKTHELPARCNWCKSPNWNGHKKKQKSVVSKQVIEAALARGATSITITNTDASGNAIGTPLTIALPVKKAQPAKGKKPAIITLPKPRKVRNND